MLNYVVIAAVTLNTSTRTLVHQLFFFDTTKEEFVALPFGVASPNDNAVDVTGDDGVLWVYDQTDNKMYAYDASDGRSLT